ncbi:unnamed protein product [Didymodactylos carnosus]|uniref:Uncharacterized protein n=1 Tax=Didymodactylos carnosus TaxID=1234261 RepID=A0A814AGJ1_9BILA|nr:unnamed protein product [Didymodactylos carnosus]CAF0961811.1 unnamed protein product [Didymodactylos carnosus]CAF3692561.1 unnamed protein product [Didymodactylos carnosus]CAF3734574.1 unnamed protein product [Didymodactylos carnosus]
MKRNRRKLNDHTSVINSIVNRVCDTNDTCSTEENDGNEYMKQRTKRKYKRQYFSRRKLNNAILTIPARISRMKIENVIYRNAVPMSTNRTPTVERLLTPCISFHQKEQSSFSSPTLSSTESLLLYSIMSLNKQPSEVDSLTPLTNIDCISNTQQTNALTLVSDMETWRTNYNSVQQQQQSVIPIIPADDLTSISISDTLHSFTLNSGEFLLSHEKINTSASSTAKILQKKSEQKSSKNKQTISTLKHLNKRKRDILSLPTLKPVQYKTSSVSHLSTTCVCSTNDKQQALESITGMRSVVFSALPDNEDNHPQKQQQQENSYDHFSINVEDYRLVEGTSKHLNSKPYSSMMDKNDTTPVHVRQTDLSRSVDLTNISSTFKVFISVVTILLIGCVFIIVWLV